MRIAFILLTLITALSTCFVEAQSVPDQQVTLVSTLQLIVTPEKFDGRLISVVGFLNLGRERDVLYVHQEDAIHVILSNGVLVDSTEQIGKDRKTVDNKYVQIVGVFRAGREHTMPFVGTISDIRKCRPWSDPNLPISRRLKEIPGVSDNP